MAGLRARSPDAIGFEFIVALSLLDTAAIVGLAVLFLRLRGERVRDVLFGHQRIGAEIARGLLYVPLIFAIVLALGALIQYALPWMHNVTRNPLQAMLSTPWRVAIFAVVVVLAGGVREEVQRGFILHRFERDLGGARIGLALFSVVFGLGHLTQGYDAGVITGVLGLLWGVMFLRRRSIVAPIVSHALFNLIEIALFQYASRAGLLPQQ